MPKRTAMTAGASPPSRPLPDVAGEAYGFLAGTAHVELPAGPTPPFPLLLGTRQRRQSIRDLSCLETGAIGSSREVSWVLAA